MNQLSNQDRGLYQWPCIGELPARERAARVAAGQMPHHGTSMDELGFTHLKAEYEGVEIELGPKDFLSVTDEQIESSWGPGPKVGDTNQQPLMLACDSKYFDWFGLPLVESMGDEWASAFVMPLKGDRLLCHALRFIRFYQKLRDREVLWMMDVDALFNRSPKELFASIGEKDTAFRIRPGRLEPWNQFSAGIVGAKQSALPYFRAIAQFLTAKKGQWFWGIDQLAMYLAYRHLEQKPSVAFLDDKIFNLNCDPDGIVWILGGTWKFDMLKGKVFDAGSPEERYAEKFRSLQ